MRTVFCVFALFLASALAEGQYEGYKLLQVNFTTLDGFRLAKGILGDQADFWNGPFVGYPTDVLLPPGQAENAFKVLKGMDYSVKILNENIQEAFDKERELNEEAKSKAGGKIVGYFPRFDEICSGLQTYANNFRTLATYKPIGQTTQGRTMCMITLGNTGIPNKKNLFMDWGIHAREWLSPATAIWLVDHILNNYNFDSGIKNMLDKVSWNWVIAANPDGYEYTHTNSRLWRKTRSGPVNGCYGVDPNRNYDYMFAGEGTSSNPCTDIYHGPFAFSEPETRNLRDQVLALRPLTFYAALHTYVPAMMSVYGYTDFGLVEPANGPELRRVGALVAQAINAVNGQNFRAGNSAVLLGAAAGASDDWAVGGGGATYGYTLELRAGSLGGFVASTADITPSGREVLAGFKVIAQQIA